MIELPIKPKIGLGPWRFGMSVDEALRAAPLDYEKEVSEEGDI